VPDSAFLGNNIMQNARVMKVQTYKIPQSVLVVIYTSESDVLLIRRTDAGTWQSVTGSKDFEHESWEETAIREVKEETGLNALATSFSLTDWTLENVYEIYPAWRYRYAPDVTHNTERVFGLALPARQPIQLSPTEHTEFKWAPWQEAADTCFSPSNAEAILMLPRWLSCT
jgi:dATP pyrophosphohydrolase